MSSIRAKNISWLLCMPHTVVQVVSCTRVPQLRRYIHKDFLVKWQSSILSKGIDLEFLSFSNTESELHLQIMTSFFTEIIETIKHEMMFQRQKYTRFLNILSSFCPTSGKVCTLPPCQVKSITLISIPPPINYLLY